MTQNWLLLDIGNTHTVAGLFSETGQVVAEVRFRTNPLATADEYRVHLHQMFAEHLEDSIWEVADRAIVSTVVPVLEKTVRGACAGGRRPIAVISISSKLKRDFELDLPFPDQLGADRLANVAGALTIAEPPFLLVDAGTATTFCIIDARPAYIGGAIVPGLDTSWRALQSRAAKLFSVELVRPQSAVGNTTETQIQSGVLQGYEALIEGLADRLLRDSGLEGAKLIATGGCTRLITLSSRFDIQPDLTLRGLFRYGVLNG